MKENYRKGMVSLQIITPRKGYEVPSPSERMASAWARTGKAFKATGKSIRLDGRDDEIIFHLTQWL